MEQVIYFVEKNVYGETSLHCGSCARSNVLDAITKLVTELREITPDYIKIVPYFTRNREVKYFDVINKNDREVVAQYKVVAKYVKMEDASEKELSDL